jgi:formylglycine-generating enzyme required for sulfatase activity
MMAAMRVFRISICLAAMVLLAVPEALCATIAGAKVLRNGSSIVLESRTVTYASADFFYIQESNHRTSYSSVPVGGIRVNKTAHGFTAGVRVNVSGKMGTASNLERCIECTSVAGASGAGTVAPWMMTNGRVGQPNNVGLLVRTTGFVQYADSAASVAYIDDGSGLYDGNTAGPLAGAVNGLRVIVPSSLSLPKATQYVTVTGISTTDLVAGNLVPVLLARDITRNDAAPVADMAMICVPGGQFLMGNSGVGDDATYGYPREYPQHPVDVPAFWISKTEVTRDQFNQFIAAGGYSNPAYWSGDGWAWKLSVNRTQPDYWASTAAWEASSRPVYWDPRSFTQTGSHPAVGVSYYEAEAFCKWAGGRLPTEAEWEKAARWDGSPRIYPWGSTTDASKCNDWFDTSYRGFRTSPVNSYPSNASPYGCADMSGNVWEWTQDWYQPYPGSSAPFDQTGIARSVRGGAWYGDYGDRCACRWFLIPSFSRNDVGFRIAR